MPSDEQDNRERILAAARRHFNSPGYNSARVADIAKDAGVSRATVYNHFPDKDAILAALVDEYLAGYARIGEAMSATVDVGDTVFAILLRMVEDTLMWRVENADLRPAIDVARQVLPANVLEANRAADEVLRGHLADVYRRSTAHGIVRDDIDPEFAASALYSMIEAVLNATDVGSSVDEIKSAALQLALLQWYAVYTIVPEQSPRLDSI